MKYSAWIAVQYEDRFLLLQRGKKANNPNQWNLPGGGVEEGEDPRVTVVRELWEEAHIKVKKSDIKFIKRITKGDRQMFFYHIELEEKPKVKIDFESQNFKWKTLDEFPKKLHYQTKMFHKHRSKFELAHVSIAESEISKVVKDILSKKD